jgi:hypothetical protein
LGQGLKQIVNPTYEISPKNNGIDLSFNDEGFETYRHAHENSQK